jgi:hypothetical protein
MTNFSLPYHNNDTLRETPPLEISSLIETFKRNIWVVGMLFCGFGLFDRSVATFIDNMVSPLEVAQISIALFFSLGWLVFKPEKFLDHDNEALPPNEEAEVTVAPDNHFLATTRSRMLELKKQHLISQAYTLPFPYLCQIYHLLNLKHLESIHDFSLNNLKIKNVNHFEATDHGGVLRFETILETPINALRMWRLPTVEVELILHTPYTIELSIPTYGNKRIIVLFNVQPLDRDQHKLFIDIYSDLAWYRPLLQLVLHFASLLTLVEDLPYLRTLAKRDLTRLMNVNRLPEHETMGLFKRFVELYGSKFEAA